MRKPRTRRVKTPDPFDVSASKTERSAVAVLMHWMRQIIEKNSLDLGLPDVDTTGADRKSPDTVIYESHRSQNVLCVIEAKPPHYDVFNYEQLKKPAWEKANKRRAKYFATTNFQELIWFNTEKVNAQKTVEEQVVDKYCLSELEDLNLVEETRYKESIINQLERFLTKLYAVHSGKEPEPKQAIDEFLIFRLHDKIRRLARYYATIIEDQCHKDRTFSAKLGKWFNDQGWSFAWQAQDFDKAARQTAYLLVNKILFYDLLQAKRPNELPPLEIPKGLLKGSQLQKILQSFFDEALKIDYETIYTTDFIDSIAFPDQKEVVGEVKELVSILQEYDFSRLGYEIIGGIFQKLIPQDERHNLGQYFTNPDVVDLILCFCLRQESDKVFDPSCGAGTFLVRAYQHKKLMNQYLKHEDILETLWGNDIAKFPAHLSTINLAINDLSVDRNYPNIMQEDFFALLSTEQGFELPEKQRKVKARTLDINGREIEYPHWFDCIVGNPPYTRQEEIAEIAPEDRLYKERTIDKALNGINGRRIADIPKRAGIYAYFFVHGSKLLRNGGRFGFVVSESWLDVDYGRGLQEFFLNHYKIIAIIGSKVERWFEDADINTCIVILEKCSGDERRSERDDSLVRFVYLKKPLRYFIPAAQDIWEKQVQRLSAIKDKFVRTILAHSELYEGDDFRICPVKQEKLWKEGYDAVEQKYTGAKWGKYLRAPDIFFTILEKGKDKLVPLKQIADVRRGFTTGANEFFYVEPTGKRAPKGLLHIKNGVGWEGFVEERFLKPVLRRPKECESIQLSPDSFRFWVFLCHEEKANLRKTHALKYIKWGEEKGFAKRSTCSSRVRWYDLGQHELTNIAAKMTTKYRHYFPGSPKAFLVDHRFYEVRPLLDDLSIEALLLSLNSAVTALYLESTGRTYGGGGGPLDIMVYEMKEMLIVDPRLLRSAKSLWETGIAKRPILHFWKEAEKRDRRELDKFIMGDILGLTEEEQLEVYRAVIDLVKSRLEKAKSFGNHKNTKEGIDIDMLVRIVTEKIGEETLGKFYQENIVNHGALSPKSLPKDIGDIRIKHSLFGWRLYSGKKSIDCASELEARYLKVWLEAGVDKVNVPQNESYLQAIVPQLESLKQRIDEIIEPYLGSIVNVRTQDRILHQLWVHLTKGVQTD